MKINPLNPKHISRLQESIEWSRRQLGTPCRKRHEAIKQFVGHHYTDGGNDRRVPVNFLALAAIIHVRQLAPKAPRVMMSTKLDESKVTAYNMELAMNQIPEEIRLGKSLQRLVLESLFGLGVARVGLHDVGKVMGIPYGKSFVDIIGMDDYFIDMTATDMEEIDYEGNSYWLDYDAVMESGWADKKATDGLAPDEYTAIGEDGENRAEGIQSSESHRRYKDKLWVRDVWLPSDGLLVTYAIKSRKVLKTIEWDGIDRGPYVHLGFVPVPGNLLPLPPVALWRDIHELANKLFRKIGKQGESQKSVLGFTGGDTDSIEAFKKASDGDGITYNGAEPKVLSTTGVDQKTLAFFLQTKDLASYFGGNLDATGGLAPMSGTVGQDKLLGEAAGAQMRDMADKVVEATREIFRALAHYEWHDPIARRILEKPIPGTDMTIPVPFGPEDKRGSFSAYDLRIDVHSLQDDSPSLKLQRLSGAIQEFVLPMFPMIQAAGGNLDVQKLMKFVAKYTDLEELAEIVTFIDQAPPAAEPSGMPANTTRTYERVGRPGKTPQGAIADMQQLLMGGGVGG